MASGPDIWFRIVELNQHFMLVKLFYDYGDEDGVGELDVNVIYNTDYIALLFNNTDPILVAEGRELNQLIIDYYL